MNFSTCFDGKLAITFNFENEFITVFITDEFQAIEGGLDIKAFS